MVFAPHIRLYKKEKQYCPVLFLLQIYLFAKTQKAYKASKITVCDPACGSGSFLIRAFEILDEHVKREKNQKGLDSAINYARKIQILTSNIYGVDLDKEAVEIARLNLLLKVVEMRSHLPNLVNNIECGNSLISGIEKDLEKSLGKDWRDKKPFNWKEKFNEVFKQGGFDVVIGNPPYIKEYVDKSAFDGLHDDPYYQGKMDIWTLFACQAIDHIKDGGYFSFIAPNNWLTNAGASIFRNKILKEGEIVSFIDFGDFKVFEDAGIQTMIFIFKKCPPSKKYKIQYSKIIDKNINKDRLIQFLNKQSEIAEIVSYDVIFEPEKFIDKNINFSTSKSNSIFDKLESKRNFELNDDEVGQGIVAAPDHCFLTNNISKFSKEEREYLKPFFTSTNRYTFIKSNTYIFYLSQKNFDNKSIENYPNIKNHFEPFKEELKEAKNKYRTPDKPYYFLHRERDEKFFQKGSKIVGATRTSRPGFLYTEEEYYGSRAMNFIKTDRINLRYLTGILNSRLVYFWLKNKGKQLGDLLQIDKGPLLSIPLIKSNEKKENIISQLVEKNIKLNQELHKLDPILDQEDYGRKKQEILLVDGEIDEDVYKLYDLNPEEIEIIESGTYKK